MKEESENWMRDAEEDLGTAEDCEKAGRHKAAAFHSQQAAEKSLKALEIQKVGRFDKVHDLLTLARIVKAPDEVTICCIKLNPYYTAARYPDVKGHVSGDTARELLIKSREVLRWVKQSLKQ